MWLITLATSLWLTADRCRSSALARHDQWVRLPDPVEARRRYVADRWWMSAAAVTAIGGGVLMPLHRWWSSLLGMLLIIGGIMLIAAGLYRGPRGRA